MTIKSSKKQKLKAIYWGLGGWCETGDISCRSVTALDCR